MFVILTYDINKIRVSKVLKVCCKYLTHHQKSVFEGMITESKLNKLKKELEKVIEKDEDSVCIYKIESLKYTSREEIGVVETKDNIL
ncbi:MAG: CRISPR-associated endonuclease Cas2 [Lachnospiraceae bacterium]|nr:CRISPR-associated endonuclease Cas2 [Lachnospiraceae bacterium]